MSINFYSNNASHNSSTVADTPPNLIKNQDSRLWRGQEKGSKVCESNRLPLNANPFSQSPF